MGFVYGKTVLLTGASSGIGEACARLLKGQGYHVYGTARKAQSDAAGKESENNKDGGFLKMLQMDVRDADSVKKVVNAIVAEEGCINILINCAGYGIAGSVEDTTAEDAMAQFDTNFFGALRVCREVLPVMRRQKSGLIVTVGSVAGLISIPFQSMYSAAKYALEALTEAMRIEVKPFGIKASLVEPGDTKTGFTASRQRTAASLENPAYLQACNKSIETMVKSEEKGVSPEKVAKVVVDVLNRKNPPIRTIVGFDYKLIALLKRLLPSRLVEFILSKIY